jgi:carboxyl-terminal processing protease
MIRNRFLTFLTCALVALLLVRPARAEEASAKAQTWIVLVGVSDYADKQIKPRPNAENDVKALYDLFTDKQYHGVTPDHIKLLIGGEDARRSERATRENVLKTLHWLTESAKPGDKVILAWVGEGASLGTKGDRRCYFTADSTFKGRDKDALDAEEIGDALKSLKAKHVAAFVDIDFKGFDAQGVSVPEPDLGKESPYSEWLGDDNTDEHNPLPGHVIFLATNGLKPSLDLKDHGLFVTALLDGLHGTADIEGEPDGVVTVDELIKFLDKQIPELARTHGKTKEQKEQLNFILGGRSSHFVLTTNPAVAEKAQKRLTEFEAQVKKGQIPAMYEAEGKLLLERMPRLEAQRKLRKQYQDLTDGTITLKGFTKNRDEILEATKINEIEATRWAKKVIEVTDIVHEKHVKETNQGELVAWAIRGLYRSIDEKVPEAIETRLKGVKQLDEHALTALLAEVRMLLGKREDLDNHKDLDIALLRMLNHLDPHTTYIDPEQKARFDQEVQGNFTGIGIQIRKDAATDYLLVVSPIKGSPAYKGGLQAGDLITTVTRTVDSDGNPLSTPEVLQTKGLLLSDAVKKIQGKAGTKVRLSVLRDGVDKPLDIEITRGRVEVETVMGVHRKVDDEWEYWIDPESKIAYVRLTMFGRNSAADLRKVVQNLNKEGMKGIILDLRFNPGGLLGASVDISSLFLDGGRVVSVRNRAGLEENHDARNRPTNVTGPSMVVLVNGYSASASEIVSAALQDHNRARIFGERSYGKGSVQDILPYEGGELKLTIATFWRPSKKNLNKATAGKDGGPGKDDDVWGVTPDTIVKLDRKDLSDLAEYQHDLEVIYPKGKKKELTFKDRQLEEAVKYLRKQVGAVSEK